MAINWTKDQPAVVFLRQQVGVFFPAVGLHYDAKMTVKPGARHTVRDHPSLGVGGQVSRTTEGGGPSLHAEGRAADIYVKVQNAYLKAIGDALFTGFVANAAQLHLEEVIWNGQMWTASVPRLHAIPAGKNQHTDHVHVGFTRPGSQHHSPLLVTVLRDARTTVEAQFAAPVPAGP